MRSVLVIDTDNRAAFRHTSLLYIASFVFWIDVFPFALLVDDKVGIFISECLGISASCGMLLLEVVSVIFKDGQ